MLNSISGFMDFCKAVVFDQIKPITVDEEHRACPEFIWTETFLFGKTIFKEQTSQ